MSLYHTNSRGADQAAVTRAVSQAVALAQRTGHKVCRIAVHTKPPFLVGVFSKVYGHDFVKAAATPRGAGLQDCNFFLMTRRIKPKVPAESPIIAAHVSPAWLAALIGARAQPAVIYLPWTPDELQVYLAAHPDSQQM
jgi:hypothetical protein